jgi:alkaline phosphatase D
MLGLQQRTWLEESLRRSDATWKVIVSSVPLAVPTGGRGRDGWANHDHPGGFERELLDLLRFIQMHGVRNTLWISTDIHYAAVFRHTPFADTPSYSFYELDTGPLNSGVYPKREYDRSLGARQLFLFPESTTVTAGFPQAKSWFNFGVAQIDGDGRLTIEIITADGVPIYALAVDPAP